MMVRVVSELRGRVMVVMVAGVAEYLENENLRGVTGELS